MIRAALKSLLGRKLRLLMSTFAIVLGVAFVAGSLVFSDTLSRSFTALFASTVGDVVVRPAGGATLEGAPVDAHRARRRWSSGLRRLPGAARVDGNVSAVGVYVVGKDDGKVVGGFGPPAFGANWTDAPGRPRPGGALDHPRPRRRAGRARSCSTTAPPTAAGYHVGDDVRLVTATARAMLSPRLVGIAGFRQGGSLNGATLALVRHRDRAGPLPRRQGRLHRRLGDRRATASRQARAARPGRRGAARRHRGGHRRHGGRRVRLRRCCRRSRFLTTFLLIFAGIALVVGALPHRQHVLDPGRPAQPRAGAAARAGRLEAPGHLVGAARGVRARRCSARRSGLGLGVLLAMGIRSLFARFGLDLSGQPLIFAPRTVRRGVRRGRASSRWPRPGCPARRTGRIAPVQALRDDVAMPESSLRRRLLLGVVLIAGGLVALVRSACSPTVPHAGWFVGAGVLRDPARRRRRPAR